MKKLFAVLLIFSFWIPLSGFSGTTSATVIYSSGPVKEVVSFTISAEDAQNAGTNLQILGGALQTIMPIIKLELLERFDQSADVSVEGTLQPNSNGYEAGFVLTFASFELWKTFCQTEAISSVTQDGLFTKTTVTQSPPRLTFVEDDKTAFQFVYESLLQKLSALVQNPNALVSQDFTYTYALKAVRLHSDADLIEVDPKTNYTYHTWQIAFDEEETITFWQVRANVISWYILALVITAGVGLTLWFISKNKNPKIAEK